MTTSIELLSDSLPNPVLPELPKFGTCCVSGKTCLTVSRRYAIKPSFTRSDLFVAPTSDRVGLDAWKVLNEGSVRKSSWWCDGNSFVRLDKTMAFQFVLNPPDVIEWTGYVTTSYKKHGALQSVVNLGDSNTWLFETTLVDCSNSELVNETVCRLAGIYYSGARKRELESLNVSLATMKTVGLVPWLEFERWAVSRVESQLYKFILHLLPSKASQCLRLPC